MSPASPKTLPRFLRWFSSHCVLRQIDPSDVPRIWKALQHPAYERCWTGSIPDSEDAVAAFVRDAQTDWARGTRYVLAVQRKQTQDFISWVEARAHGSATQRGVWTLDWFIHPGFIASSLALEALAASCDLMMNAVDARILCVNCPVSHELFEMLLRTTGFAQHVPAGSLDPATAAPRVQSLFVMTKRDWLAARHAAANGGPATLGGYTEPKLELSLL